MDTELSVEMLPSTRTVAPGPCQSSGVQLGLTGSTSQNGDGEEAATPAAETSAATSGELQYDGLPE